MRRELRTRGTTLGSVLMLIAVAMVFAFVLAGLAFFQMNMSSRSHSALLAENAAEAAVQYAINSELTSNITFGKNGETMPDWTDGNGAVGKLTFGVVYDQYGHRVPWSTYNYDPNGAPNTAVGYGNRFIPRDGIHLVGTGYYGGVVRSVEAVVDFPNYPFAVGANGAISLVDGIIGSVQNATDVQWVNGQVQIAPNALHAGDIVSNASMTIDVTSQVLGDAQAAGSITVLGGSVVDGEIRPNRDPINIPSINISQYDPRQNQSCVPLSGTVADTTVGGYAASGGDLTVNGVLTLNNGLLYVDGNLTINGSINGSGAIFVTHATTVNGCTSLSGTENIALVSQNDVHLTGTGMDGSIFEGFVYSGGNVFANKLTVLGSLIQLQNGGQASVTDARIVISPAQTVVNTTLPAMTLSANDQPQQTIGLYSFPALDTVVPPPPGGPPLVMVPQANPLDLIAPPGLAANNTAINVSCQIHGLPPAENATQVANTLAVIQAPQNGIAGMSDYTEYCFKNQMYQLEVRNNQLVCVYIDQGRGNGGGFGPDGNSVQNRSLLPNSPWANLPAAPNNDPLAWLSVQEFGGPMRNADGSWDVAAAYSFLDGIAQGRALNIQYMDQTFGWNYSVGTLQANLEQMFNQLIQTPNNKVPAGVNFQYNPNWFLTPADRIRVLLWKELN